MKSFVAVVLAISSVSALGSGPYLPSGWRPQGPAFFLPGEVQKPADNPFKDTLLFGSEASNSDSLREYGPPKVAGNVISQALPDEVTETSFFVQKAAEEAVVVQENTEQKSDLILEATTETLFAEVQPTIVYERLADIELQTDVTATYADEIKEVEATVATVEEKLEQVVAEKVEQLVEEKVEQVIEEKVEQVVEEQKTVEKFEQVVVQEVEAVQEGVKNIAEALVNLETEIKAEQVQNEAVAEIKVQESSGSTQVPEGFLEYGPPGFREYGPPKGDELLRTAAVVQETSNSVDARRRRFSPKFRPTKTKRIH